MIEMLLLNQVIASRDFSPLTRHGLAHVKHFPDHADIFTFIHDHVKEYAETPSIESVAARCPKFEHMDVTESADTLCLKLHERNLKLAAKDVLTEIAANFGKMDGYRVLDRMRTAVSDLETAAHVRSGSGVNWSENGADRVTEYDSRKNRDFTKKMPLFLDGLTDAVGGAERGDIVTIHASTGIGKSWLGLLSALIANRSGFNVLIESGEMSKPENQFRLDTLDGGFSNRGLWTGRLDDTVEATYRTYLASFTAGNGRAPLTIKTPDEWPNGLTIAQMESDIDRTKSDVVIIDHFGLCAFEGKYGARDFSRSLKQMATRKGVIVVLLYQANGDFVRGATKDDSGIRELRVPELGDYSETVAVIQDSAFVVGFDAVMWKDDATGRFRGKGLCGITKSRTGGAGTAIEVDWLPNDGVIRSRMPSDVF